MQYPVYLLLVFFCSIASASEREFKIEGIIEPPLRWYEESGEAVGIDIDIITEALAQMDDLIPNYRIQLYSSSPRLKYNWQKGKSDMVFTYSHKKERKEYLHYPKESHIKQSYNFFVRKDLIASQQASGNDIKFEHYSDLQGYKLAATKGIAYTPEFWKYVHEGKLDTFIVVKNELTMNMLLGKRVDIIPHNLFPGIWLAKKGGFLGEISVLPKPLKEKPYFNTFVKRSDYPGIKDLSLIKRYDEVISVMVQNGSIKRILQKYGIPSY